MFSKTQNKKHFFLSSPPRNSASPSSSTQQILNKRTQFQMVSLHRRLLDTHPVAAPPPQTGNKTNNTSSSYVVDTSFDTNMVIILAALFCALICALGLNSIVRCTLRCRRRIAMETAEQAVAARLAATGLKKRALRQIPVAVYGASGSSISATATECSICLGEFLDGEKVRVLPKCNHGFHIKCIDRWFVSHSSCPNCRHSLVLERPTNSEEACGAQNRSEPP